MTTDGTTTATGTTPGSAGIDPRGPRVVAAITAVLLAAVLLAGTTPAGLALLGVAVALFASGVALGPARSPLGVFYRTLVAPRLGPTSEREDPRPPRFAQGVGLVITGAGLALALAGLPMALPVAAGAALVAALLNAVLGLCLGCELYLVLTRARTRLAG